MQAKLKGVCANKEMQFLVLRFACGMLFSGKL